MGYIDIRWEETTVGTVEHIRQHSAEAAVKAITRTLEHDPEQHLAKIADLAERIAVNPDHRRIIADMRRYLEPDEDGELVMPMQTLLRGLAQTSPRCRSRILTDALVNSTWQGWTKREAAERTLGFRPPTILLMSPSMRCNLRCKGCYAADYTRDDDLPYEVMDRVLTEAKELGIYSVILLGGEPFIRPDVLDLVAKHADIAFMAFSNGTLITPELAARIAELGNLTVSVSIDGLRPAHDARRGAGVFDRAVRGMAELKAAGVPFGFSSMITSANCEDMIADELMDFLVDQGCLWGWHFLYMPVGEDGDPALMPTPAQRELLRERGAAYIRMHKQVFVMDFWNDAPYVGGCIAGGKYYLHINANGDVEPCIFAHFAVDNIKRTSLKDALGSPLFRAIRARQPYDKNLLRPCMIIDNTTVLRDVVAASGAHPTHPGAERVLSDLAPALDAYSAGYRPIADEAWGGIKDRFEHEEKTAAGA